MQRLHTGFSSFFLSLSAIVPSQNFHPKCLHCLHRQNPSHSHHLEASVQTNCLCSFILHERMSDHTPAGIKLSCDVFCWLQFVSKHHGMMSGCSAQHGGFGEKIGSWERILLRPYENHDKILFCLSFMLILPSECVCNTVFSLFFLKIAGFQSNNGKFCDNPCLTIDFVFLASSTILWSIHGPLFYLITGFYNCSEQTVLRIKLCMKTIHNFHPHGWKFPSTWMEIGHIKMKKKIIPVKSRWATLFKWQNKTTSSPFL